MSSSPSPCSDFDQPIVFTDQPKGGITAKKLNLAWANGQVAPCFVERQPAVAGVASGDYLLVLKADGTYAKVPGTAIGGGATGPRGSYWYDGTGAPGSIPGQQAQDQYLDLSNGDVYQYI